MGDLVNLNQYRKQRERLGRKKTAAANRAKFGRAKGEVLKDRHDRDRDRSEMDGKRVDQPSDTDDAPETG